MEDPRRGLRAARRPVEADAQREQPPLSRMKRSKTTMQARHKAAQAAVLPRLGETTRPR